MPNESINLKRSNAAVSRRADLFSKLSECITEEDVEKFYLQLMKLVDPQRDPLSPPEDPDPKPSMEAMKMFKDLVVPKSVKSDLTDQDLPELVDKKAREAIKAISERYMFRPEKQRKLVENNVNVVHREISSEGTEDIRPLSSEPGACEQPSDHPDTSA